MAQFRHSRISRGQIPSEMAIISIAASILILTQVMLVLPHDCESFSQGPDGHPGSHT